MPRETDTELEGAPSDSSPFDLVSPTLSMSEAQLAMLDDDGAPPLPDTGNCAEGYAIEGCPPSSGWRSRAVHTGLSELPVVITTWEPYGA